MNDMIVRWAARNPRLFLAAAALAWFGLYEALIPVSEALVAALPVDRNSPLGGALQFFFYDTPKVLMLLTGIVFLMGMLNSHFTPERTRAILAGRSEGTANVMAASLGVFTPFCSCSAVPLFIGFVQAGVPLGVTFSFLISAPMVNEVALTLLLGLFGWKVALLYLSLGLFIAIVAGWVIGRLKMEAYLEDWIREMPRIQATAGDTRMPLYERISAGLAACVKSSEKSGLTSSAVLPLARAFTGMCQRISWPVSWARKPGGRFRSRFLSASPCIPMRQA